MIKPGKVCSQLMKANDTGESTFSISWLSIRVPLYSMVFPILKFEIKKMN
jgi:hypothetical protein